MPLEWIPASDNLPREDEIVLLHLRRAAPTPHLARLIKGDPNHAGEHYQRDKWLLFEWSGGFPPVQEHDQWARVPAPAGVTWASVTPELLEARLVEAEEAVTVATSRLSSSSRSAQPAQPNLFEVAA